MHSILGVEELVRMFGVDKPLEEGGRSINLKCERGPELFLVADEDELLCTEAAQERLVFLDLSGFVNDDTIYLHFLD